MLQTFLDGPSHVGQARLQMVLIITLICLSISKLYEEQAINIAIFINPRRLIYKMTLRVLKPP